MADKRYADNPLGPASHAFAVVPSDGVELTSIPRALFVGTGGNITLRLADSSADVLLKNVPSGAMLDLQARFVRATGTTAADIVALV